MYSELIIDMERQRINGNNSNLLMIGWTDHSCDSFTCDYLIIYGVN